MEVINEDDHIDHKNHNKQDNRKANLRKCEVHENQKNRRLFKNNTSGVKGVSFDKRTNKWMAYININQKRKTLGHFDNIEEAEAIRKEAEIKYYGDFRYKGDGWDEISNI